MPMDLDEYLTRNRDLSFNEACERFSNLTGQSGHDINEQLRREREERHAYYRDMDGC